MPTRPSSHRPARLPAMSVDDRPSSAKRGYGRHWQRLRLLVLAEEPLCRMCRVGGRLVPAEHVDHITPREQGGTDDRDNLQPLCAPCHSRKTATEDGGFGKRPWQARRIEYPRFVVWGPAGSGKTTLVAARKAPGALVWDYDAIQATMTGLPMHSLPPDLPRVLLAMLDGLVRAVEAGPIDRELWVIVAVEERARSIACRLNAGLIAATATTEEIAARLAARKGL